MKTNRSWQVTRSAIARTDGQRRWDYAYQFLLHWAMEADTGSQPVPSPAHKENTHGNRSVCPSVDQPPATGPDD
jgi:hypothetical protein